MSERIFYAVGDVHGEYDRLVTLHETITEHWTALGGGRPATLVHIGDYIDRGPDSFKVVERLMELQREFENDAEGFEIACLMGNHERLMIDALAVGDGASLKLWLTNGGDKTLESYARAAPPGTPRLAAPPPAHIEWMKLLPTRLIYPNDGLLFVHAGVQPDRFPNSDESVYLWTRAADFMEDDHWPWNPELDALTVVHGHTPTKDSEPYVGPRRINLDTGACYGGPLTAAVFMPGEKVRFFYA